MKKLVAISALALLAGLWPVTARAAWEAVDDTLTTLDEELEDGSVIGMGVGVFDRVYEDVDTDVYPVPIIQAEYKQFFFDIDVGGYYLQGPEEPLRIGLIAGPHIAGYNNSDSDVLGGMDDRDWGFDLGGRLKWNTELVNLTLDAVADVSGTYEGQEVRLTLSKQFLEGFLTPRIGVAWQSEDLVDYYYGVRPNEATAARSEYLPDSEFVYTAGLTVGVPLGEKLALIGDVRANFLGDEIQDSPIVEEDVAMRYTAGIVYRF